MVHADVQPLAPAVKAQEHGVRGPFIGADAHPDESHDRQVQGIGRPEIIEEKRDGEDEAARGHETRLVRAVRERAGDQDRAHEPDVLRGDEQPGLVRAQSNAARRGPDDDGADTEEEH